MGNGCMHGQSKGNRGSGKASSWSYVASAGRERQAEQRHVGVPRACARSAPMTTQRRGTCACCDATVTARGSMVTGQRRAVVRR